MNIKSRIGLERHLLLAIIITLSLILVLNFLYPIWADDWKLGPMSDGTQRFPWSDFIAVQFKYFYPNWSGRVITLSIAQALLMIGKGWGDFFNSLAYVAFVLVILLISKGKSESKQLQAVFLLIIHSMVLFLSPDFGQSVLWITGSAVFLWGTLISLSLLYPYCNYYFDKGVSAKEKNWPAFFLFGIFGGWTNENMSVALISFLVGILCLLKWEKRIIPAWTISGFIGSLVGFTIMMAAPGNFVRYKVMTGQDLSSSVIRPSLYFERLASLLSSFTQHGLIPTAIFIFLLIIFFYQKRFSLKKGEFKISVLFYLSSLVAFGSMIVSPSFPDRAWFGIIAFIIISISLIFFSLDFSSVYFRRANRVILGTVLVAMMSSFVLGTQELMNVNRIVTAREKEILYQKEKGLTDIIVKGRFSCSMSNFISVAKMEDMGDDPENWFNHFYGVYHGVRSIRVLEK